MLNAGILTILLSICQSEYDEDCNSNLNDSETQKRLPLDCFIRLLSISTKTLVNICKYATSLNHSSLLNIIDCVPGIMSHIMKIKNANQEYFQNLATITEIKGILSNIKYILRFIYHQ